MKYITKNEAFKFSDLKLKWLPEEVALVIHEKS